MAEDRALLLSIKPRYADLILNGSKSIELRRTAPTLRGGAPVVLYSSSPTRAVIGTALLEGIESNQPAKLWRSVGHLAGITREQFEAYFDGAVTAFGLRLLAPRPCRHTSLGELREVGLNPAQSWRYLSNAQLQQLGLEHGSVGADADTLVSATDELLERTNETPRAKYGPLTKRLAPRGWLSPAHSTRALARAVSALRSFP